MTVLELYHLLEDLDNDTVIEFSYRTTGRFSDDSDTYYVKVTEAKINSARKTLVLE